MSGQSERQRNNVRAGIFVSVTLLMAIVTVFILTNAWRGIFSSSNEYTVIYDVSSGVRNLKDGADVRVGGRGARFRDLGVAAPGRSAQSSVGISREVFGIRVVLYFGYCGGQRDCAYFGAGSAYELGRGGGPPRASMGLCKCGHNCVS